MSDCMDWEQEERILHRLTDQSTGSTCRQLWGTALMPSETVSVQHKTPEREREREREIFLFLDAVDVWMSEQRRHRRDRGERRQLSPSYTAAVSRPYVRINQKSANTHTHTHTHTLQMSILAHTHTRIHLCRRFYPKWLTVHSGYTFFVSECSLGIELTTFALLTQCSTTEPQEHTHTEYYTYIYSYKYVVTPL